MTVESGGHDLIINAIPSEQAGGVFVSFFSVYLLAF